ncbi:MAG: mandelate racemase/muconate lactonizing enzyme family protein [Nitrososphaeria archaeon]
MKISNIETIPVSCPLEEEAFDATVRWKDFNMLFVKVTTGDGLTGIGEIAPLHGREMPIFESIIRKRLKERVIGEEPYDLEKIWVKMVGKGSDAYALGSSGAVITAASAIDIALWDMVSRSFSTPLYNLLGGRFRDSVELYLSFMGDVPIDRLKRLKAKGFKALKLKVGFNVRNDVQKIRYVRGELGNDLKLMLDCNQGFSLDQAIKFTELASKHDPYWLEEPINVHNMNALNALLKKSKIPLALGENYYTLQEFISVMEKGIASFIQPDINHAGGLTRVKKIVSIAECYDVKLAPHMHSIIGFVVGLHALTACPSGLIAEYPMYGERWEFRDKLIEKCVTVEDGKAELICKNGIGVELDESYIKDYIVKG